MAEIKVFRFVVEGAGEFPYDMLRYDATWPETGEDAAMLARRNHERRRVTMNSLREPTEGRWESFLWRVVVTE